MPLWDDVREIAREQVEYRELLLELTRRDLLVRYKQTMLGFGWAISMPLVNMIVFSVVFTRVARLETTVPYPLFAFAGLLPWSFFASSLRFAADSLTRHASLITKVYFPREVLPFSAIAVGLVDFGVGAVVLMGLMLYYGVGVTWSLLALPIVVLVQVLFTAGISLLLAMGNLFYRDVKYLFELVLTVWMFATSVVYPIEHVGGRLGAILMLNPMTHIIDAYRTLLFAGHLPSLGPFLATAGGALVFLTLSWLAFHRMRFSFAENV